MVGRFQAGGNYILGLRGGSVSFAVDLIAGVEYSLTQRFSLGGRYISCSLKLGPEQSRVAASVSAIVRQRGICCR